MSKYEVVCFGDGVYDLNVGDKFTYVADYKQFDVVVTKADARKSLEKGDKVKASIKFKGRQISHPELGKDVLVRFSNELSDIADIEIQPKMEGKSIFMQLTPKK